MQGAPQGVEIKETETEEGAKMKVYRVYDCDQEQETVAIFDNEEQAQHLCSIAEDVLLIEEREINKMPSICYRVVISKLGGICSCDIYIGRDFKDGYSLKNGFLIVYVTSMDGDFAKRKALALYKKLITVKNVEQVEWKEEFLNTSGELPE